MTDWRIRCPVEVAVGDMGYFRLTCSLEEGHPGLHNDHELEVMWKPRTEADDA